MSCQEACVFWQRRELPQKCMGPSERQFNRHSRQTMGYSQSYPVISKRRQIILVLQDPARNRWMQQDYYLCAYRKRSRAKRERLTELGGRWWKRLCRFIVVLLSLYDLHQIFFFSKLFTGNQNSVFTNTLIVPKSISQQVHHQRNLIDLYACLSFPVCSIFTWKEGQASSDRAMSI